MSLPVRREQGAAASAVHLYSIRILGGLNSAFGHHGAFRIRDVSKLTHFGIPVIRFGTDMPPHACPVQARSTPLVRQAHPLSRCAGKSLCRVQAEKPGATRGSPDARPRRPTAAWRAPGAS
jgi:hypothetical protein